MGEGTVVIGPDTVTDPAITTSWPLSTSLPLGALVEHVVAKGAQPCGEPLADGFVRGAAQGMRDIASQRIPQRAGCPRG